MNVFFIMFMARSGSTWLGKILSAHPEVLYHQHAWMNKEGCLTDGQKACLEDRLLRLANDHSGKHDCKPHFSTVTAPKAMVLKDSHLAQEPAVCVNTGRLIALIRDPRAQINSLINHYPAGRNYGIEAAAQRWAARHDLYFKLADENPGRVLIVKYERMLKQPQIETAKILEFMGLQMAPRVAKFIGDTGAKHEGHWKSLFKDRARVNKAWRLQLSPGAQSTIKAAVSGSRAAGLYGL